MMKSLIACFQTCFKAGLKRGLSLATLAGLTVMGAGAQTPQARILGGVENGTRVAVAGSKPPRALPANDAGRLPSGTKIVGASIVFNRSVAQAADLDALLAAQQNPASPLYHQWLTPDQFAARFGMADADLAKVRTWLEGQGFTVDAVGRGRDRLTFSGTAAQMEAAFQTEMHYFKAANEAETHFAPASDLTVPAAMAGSVMSVGNLSDFRPKPHFRQSAPVAQFTSGQTTSHFLTPADVATIYDVNAAYSAGYTGVGQSIAAVGQSAIIPTDITNFQSAAGLPVQAPNVVLMPGTGTSTIYSGDESESDLDIEYSGGIAKGATVYFVYTGSSPNYGVFDAMTYAVQNNIAPIVTASYGECETALGQTSANTYAAIFQQAMSQGQTLIASSGDDGSTDCYGFTNLTSTQRTALTVDFPASSPYVTGLGGTEFLAADVTTTSTQYWSANGTSDVVSSALSYIPEMVWNDDSASGGLGSGGGGASAIFARPTWQISSGAPGLGSISGSSRLVPDISLSSSPNNAGYLYCSSDTGATAIQGSCSHGFRDANSQYLTVAGGTSFAAPVFAGMLAIINQATKSAGQGLINPTLYSLASNSATYAAAFHDITVGNNECTAGASYCTTAGLAGFAAGVGYDQASGLGSIDLYHLLAAWPVASGTAVTASTITLTAASTIPRTGATDIITIAVGPGTAANGTVNLSVNGGAALQVTLTNGVASYPFMANTAGQYVVVASYAGSATYSASTASLLLQVGGTGTFTISSTSPAITDGSTGTATITVTPSNGYTGTVGFAVSANPTIANACYTVTNATVSGTTAATATLSIITNQANCTTGTTTLLRHPLGAAAIASGDTPPHTPARRSPAPVGLALAGLLGIGFIGRRSRGLKSIVAVALLALAGFGISGCGSGTVTASPISASTTYATKGAYTIVLQGTDSANGSNTQFTTFTLTVQ